MFFTLWDKILQKTNEPKSPLGIPPNRALLDATDTFFRKPAIVTRRAPHVRDATDLKRFMITVVVALLPCLVWGIYNTGRNSYLAIGVDDPSLIACFVEGAVWVLPILVITYAVGGFWEGLFAQLRGHEVSEGFLVSGMLYSLIVPATMPWWQVALGISFGVVIGKEVFGGVGMNILNPALTGRAFLFFAYPAQISGDVWVPTPVVRGADGTLSRFWQTTVPSEHVQSFIAGNAQTVDGYSGATALAVASENVPDTHSVEAMHELWSVSDMFLGFVPGSIGETSVLMVLIGALILILTGVGSWRTMVGVFAGGFLTAGAFYLAAGPDNPTYWQMAPYEHLLLGGFAFGAVFMATDPVTAPFHKTSKLIYGFLIGALCIIIRLINPAYPEGMMLAILFMNVFAPLIDHYVVGAALNRRARNAAN